MSLWLICTSRMANDIENFIMCIFAICIFSFMNHLFKSILKLGCLVFYCSVLRIVLRILDMWFANTFFPVTNLTSFHNLLTVSSFSSIFHRINIFNFIKIKVNFINFFFYGLCFGIISANLFLTAGHKSFSYSLLRFHFSTCSTYIHTCVLKDFYHRCLKVFVWKCQYLLISWFMSTNCLSPRLLWFSWLFIYQVILDFILDILYILLWDSESCSSPVHQYHKIA